MTFARWTARRAAAPGLLALVVWLSGGCAVHHHHHYPAESQAPSEVPGAQVERSATETAEPRAEASPDVYDAALEPTAPSSEAVAEPVHPKNSPAPQAEPYPPAAPASHVASVSAFSPFEGCAIDDDPTGWVVAECGEQRTIVQTGAAARGPLGRLFAYAGDTASGLQGESVSYWGDRGRIRLSSGTFETVEFELRANKIVGGFSGDTAMPDEQGRVVARGVYTLAPSSLGTIGMLCVQDGQLDRRRCEATFEALTSEPIEGFGQPPGDVARVAGMTLRSFGECYFASKGELGCPGGSLKWKRDTRAELQRTFDEILEEWTDSMGIEGHHNPYTTRECTIGGQPATCHRVDYNGVLDAPFRVLHMAMVKDSGDDLLLHCSYTTSGPAPEPCRQAFSDAR